MKITCLLRGHRFSKWQFIADKSCRQSRPCTRCGIQEQRVNHGRSNAELPHEWRYKSSNSCEGSLFCARCDTPLVTEFRHALDLTSITYSEEHVPDVAADSASFGGGGYTKAISSAKCTQCQEWIEVTEQERANLTTART